MQRRTANWKQNSQIFHERAKEYDEWFKNSLLYSIEKAAIHSLDITFSAPALEVGVGPGRFAEALHIPFGIDPAMAPLLLAEKRGICTCQAIAEELPFAKSSLGAIFLLFTLCFLESPALFLKECRRVLRPNAPLVIGLVPADSAWGLNLLRKKEQNHPFYQAARLSTIAQVQQLLTAHGFHILKSASTLYQLPEKLVEFEQVKFGMDEKAGFVVIVARHEDF
ncbi:MAG: class I SAM-dependent methyltransferase [Proteobacteria bacterium]|nr:class I SAM-dependent methyltransferase [Pseudomonadota bacterium]MBU1647865.1 class I SAM-dependent methyltransferase [Pseudomonadota bacterium]